MLINHENGKGSNVMQNRRQGNFSLIFVLQYFAMKSRTAGEDIS